MTARTVRASGAMASRRPVVIDLTHRPAHRGDGGRGDALVALGYRIDAALDRAMAPLAVGAACYFGGHVAAAALRWLL